MHKVDSSGTATEDEGDITFGQVAEFYSNVFKEFKPKPKADGAVEEAQQSFDGSHMD